MTDAGWPGYLKGSGECPGLQLLSLGAWGRSGDGPGFLLPLRRHISFSLLTGHGLYT